MIYLRTGKPGASKTLNSIKEIVGSYDSERPNYYNNIRLLMLDMDVCRSFSGFFYGWYWPRLKDTKLKTKLTKILKQVHENDEFVTIDDLPWLLPQYEAHNHFDTWVYWVNRVYEKASLVKFNDYLKIFDKESEDFVNVDMFEVSKRFNLHFTHFDDPLTWHELPKRSVILIDECQQFFPPRGVGAKVPAHVAKFQTHRHDGHDVHLITQDPKLMDVNIRRLVGRHVHYHNPFGGNTVTRYHNSKAFDPDQWFDLKAASKSPIRHDKRFYGVYWSSELHTHGFKMPVQFFVFIGLVVLVCFACYYLYNTLGSGTEKVDTKPVVEALPSETVPAVKSNSPLKNPPELDEFFVDLTENIFISGSTIKHTSTMRIYTYSFINDGSGAVFFPEYVGMEIEAKSHCFAILTFGSFTRPVTCNPNYVRVSSDDDDADKVSVGDKIIGKES